MIYLVGQKLPCFRIALPTYLLIGRKKWKKNQKRSEKGAPSNLGTYLISDDKEGAPPVREGTSPLLSLDSVGTERGDGVLGPQGVELRAFIRPLNKQSFLDW